MYGVDDQLWNITEKEATAVVWSRGGRNRKPTESLSASDPARRHFLPNYGSKKMAAGVK